jgi:hypothetical protein
MGFLWPIVAVEISESITTNLAVRQYRSSQDGIFDLLLGGFPVDECRLARLDELLTLVEQVSVPLGHFEQSLLWSDTVPECFHHPKFFVEREILNFCECDHRDVYIRNRGVNNG